MRSYASRNQLAAYPGERNASQELEWERRYVTVLGAANKRLYQFRLQTADNTFEKNEVRDAPFMSTCYLGALNLCDQAASQWMLPVAWAHSSTLRQPLYLRSYADSDSVPS